MRPLGSDDDMGVMTTFRLPYTEALWLRNRARELGVSASSIIRDALKSERQAVEMQDAA